MQVGGLTVQQRRRRQGRARGVETKLAALSAVSAKALTVAAGLMLAACYGAEQVRHFPGYVPHSGAEVPAEQGACERDACEVAANLAQRYTSGKIFQSAFQQWWFDGTRHKVTKVGEGIVIVERSGRYAFHYSNGDRVTMRKQRVFRFRANGNVASAAPSSSSFHTAALIHLVGDDLAELHLRLRKADSRHSFVGHVLEARPHGAGRTFSRLYLYLARETYEVERVVVVTPEMNMSRFTFGPWKVVSDVSGAAFDVRVTPGATWVEWAQTGSE